MSTADWSFMTNVLTAPSCARGVTAGVPRPNGGGSFVYAMNTLVNTPGTVARYTNQNNFAPMAKGAIVEGALVRALSGGNTGWSAFLFCGAGGIDIADTAYLLGLSDGDPCTIELRKGAISVGLPDEAVGGASKILRRSTGTVPIDEWVHLKLEQVVNDNGDVVLNVYRNDLVAHAVDVPTWVAIPGMTQIIDDAMGINTGSVPLTAGYAGFGATFADVARRAYFDQLAIARQLEPVA